MSLPPEVFSRLHPQLFLEKHFELGLRPGSLRKFDEERPVITHTGALNTDESHILGSAITRQGGTTVVCGITASTSEVIEAHGNIYPNVEVLRGTTTAPPTPEEMGLSQQLYEYLQALSIDADQDAFTIETKGEDGSQQSAGSAAQSQCVFLQASIQVLSRSGPCLEVCCNTLIAALADTKLPSFSFDLDTGKLQSDFSRLKPLKLPFDVSQQQQKFLKSFAVWNHSIINDIEGDAEETVLSRNSEVSVLSVQEHGQKRLKAMTIRAMPYGSSQVNKEDIAKMFERVY